MSKKIYFIQESGSGAIKIGWSNSTEARKNALQIGTPHSLTILGEVPGEHSVESKIHKKFDHLRISGEWFKPEKELLDFIDESVKAGGFSIDNQTIVQWDGEWSGECPGDLSDDEYFGISKTSSMLGVSEQTLRNWDNQGLFIPKHTPSGHRRYSAKQIAEFRKKQIQQKDFILHNVSVPYLKKFFDDLLKPFKPDEVVYTTISHDIALSKIRVIVESKDGLTTICKTFNTLE